jgi:phosphatidylserine/phosphatidylglycerophosphate/cardiolipin synthase-like enzyme
MGAPTDINVIVANFFVDAADLTAAGSIPGELVPDTTSTNTVTPLIDGDNYFGALRAEVDALKAPGGPPGRFFYFTSWWLELVYGSPGTVESGDDSTAWRGPVRGSTAFKLDDESGGAFPIFLQELEDMAANGVDVRALPWVNPFIPNVEAASAAAPSLFAVNAATLESAAAMRRKPHLKTSVCLNTVGHPIAAMHLKCVICRTATGSRAYVSGIDFVSNRVDNQHHPNGAGSGGWHDVGARIEGPAVLGVFKYFKLLWDEVIGRSVDKFRLDAVDIPSYVEGTTAVPDQFTATPVGVGTQRVQVLRTAPQFHTAIGSTSAVPVDWLKRLVGGFSRKPLSFAPNGIFEFRAALRKAISNANDLIYVEDQGFESEEIMDWLNARLKAVPALKVILVHGADPADPPSNFTAAAVNDHLATGIATPASQIAFVERTDNTVIHAKTWIVDDVFAIIGSANFFRRSLYSDGEISVGIVDETTTSAGFVPQYRANLWAEHCNVFGAGVSAFADLVEAIKIWDSTWEVYGTAAVGPLPGTLSATFQRKAVPFAAGVAPDQFPSVDTTVDPVDRDQQDPDSRDEL